VAEGPILRADTAKNRALSIGSGAPDKTDRGK